jgi:hypothetical protein
LRQTRPGTLTPGDGQTNLDALAEDMAPDPQAARAAWRHVGNQNVRCNVTRFA